MPEPSPTRRAVLGAGVAAALAGCAADQQAATSTPTSGGAAASPTTSSTPPAPTTTGATTSDGSDVTHGPRTVPAVALTFHGSGDPALTTRLLAVCATRHVPITVFCVGQWARANPRLVVSMREAGHAIGNHTWSHLDMLDLDAATARREVSLGADAVRAAVGADGPHLFRPSGTPSSNAVIRAAAREAGYDRCISYDVDSLDHTDPGVAVIVRECAKAQPGSILSLHLGHLQTVTALPTVLDALAARGLGTVTVPDLLRIS